MGYDIVNEFKNSIRHRILNSDLSHMYKLLFNLYTDEELEETLNIFLVMYQEDKENWFYHFHKSIRQTDFFTGLRVTKHVNKLTPEQIKRRNELLEKRRQEASQFCPNGSDEEYAILNAKPERKADLAELRALNTLFNNEDEISNGGIFDSFLWCLISIDSKNELKNAMELTFRICGE